MRRSRPHYSYDTVNRLSREWAPGVHRSDYEYDTHGNITSSTYDSDAVYEYDANNRIIESDVNNAYSETSVGSVLSDWHTDYSYNANGDLISSSKHSNHPDYPEMYQSSEETYTYNDFGQLIAYSDSYGYSATYTYYADGLRASKTMSYDICPDVTTTYYYDGGNVINESREGQLYAINVMGADGYISRTQSGTTSYYMKNAHGDIVYAVTESGAKSFSAVYNAWGEIVDGYDPGSRFSSNPICYAGEFYDNESGMIYLRGRYYDPETRRFITEDPAKDGWNWYTYCGNNPVMRVDPTGYAPGDWFSSIDDATIDFGMHINDWSIAVNAEYGTYIYSFVVYETVQGEYGSTSVPVVYYSYAEPYTQWNPAHIEHPDIYKIEYDSNYTINVVALAHTHAGVGSGMNSNAIQQYITTDPETINNIAEDKNIYSTEDKDNAKKTGLLYYLVTPTGQLKVFDPNAWIFKERIITYNMPYDPILNFTGYFY